MTVKDLAKACRMQTGRIEDIEAGLETWLSTTDRQILARALRIEAYVLKEAEYEPAHPELSDPPPELLHELAENILHGVRELICPRCKKAALKCSVQEGFDIEGARIHYARAFCDNCPFVLK